MKKITALLFALIVALSPGVLSAQTSTTNCGPANCNSNQQNLGDTTNTATANNSNSSASQAGNSSDTNASGVTISPTSNNKVAQNSTNTTTGTISGGNNSAAGGAANGNQSANNNQSSASTGASTATTGASTSNSGGNKLSTGPSVSASNSGGNKLATNSTLTGGNSVSKGGAGGAGGSATGGTSTGTGIAAGGAGGKSSAANNGSTTSTVDASNHGVSTTNVKETYIPPVVPETPPSNLGVGNVAVETSACGPLQRVVKTPVNGTFYGLVKKSKVQLGFTSELVPYTDEQGNIVRYHREIDEDGTIVLYGDQVTTYTAILGTSGARNIAVGGGGSSGSWGQAGLGSSSSNQQLVTTIILRSCEAARLHVQQVLTTSTIVASPAFVQNAIAPPITLTTPVPATPDEIVPVETKKIRE